MVPDGHYTLVGRNHYPDAGSNRQGVIDPGTPPVARPAPLFFAIDPRVADPAAEHARRFVEEASVRLAAGFAVTLAGGRVLTDGFLVADADRNILSDSFRAHGMLARYGFAEVAPRVLHHPEPAVVQRRGRAAVLGIQTNTNYFHWLFEALPRLDLLRRMGLGEVEVLAPPLRPWMTEAATLVGGADLTLVTHEGAATEAEELVVPARGLSNIQTFTPHALATVARLRERVDAPVRGGRRLFVSRARSPSRNIADEDAVVAVAQTHGFERVYPEAMTVAEQIATFRQADAVAGPLGAGLANAAFMAPGAALIEFAPERRVGDATLFANMAHHHGLRYAGVVGPIAEGRGDGTARAVDRRDFLVDAGLAARAFAAV